MEELSAIAEAIRNSSSVAVIGHIKPDGDAVGAVCAVSLALENLGKKAFRIFQDKISDDLKFIYSADKIQNNFPKDENIDLIIICDCSEKKRIGHLISADLPKNVISICLDHHISNESFASFNFINSEASAACEVIYDLFSTMDIKIDSKIANCLYAGIDSDSGSFKYSNTGEHTFDIASKLVKAGADVYETSKNLWLNKPKKSIELTKILLARLSFYFDDKLTISFITLEDRKRFNADENDMGGFVGIIRDIEGVILSVFFYEEDDFWKMSVRSKDSNVSTLKISEFFGGGGHFMASGARISKAISSDEIVKNVLKLAKEIL